MKRFIAGFIFFTFLASPAFTMYSDFSQEPFLNLLQTKPLEDRELRFFLQHHYDSGNIASANIRFGYGFTKNINMYLSVLTHSQVISDGTNSESIDIKEYEYLFLTPVLKDKSNNSLTKASFIGGISTLRADQSSSIKSTGYNNQYILLGLLYDLYSKDPLIFEIAPIFVTDTKDNKSVFEASFGLKYMIGKRTALFAELPILVSNPNNWKNPYSLGLQYKLGPHIISLFVTNTYGFTTSYVLQGIDTTYYGFRFSL
ncbi:MAG: DUF5777 family beta-barrel protein [Elusimicrobia bacterium]|nr:DUF5777 family beta-barrel protein [Candidatus Liberimonas magnetica]